MKQTCDKDSILNSIRRVSGQVAGIEKMITEEREIQEVLQQVTAASSALKSVARSLLENYANGCFDSKSKLNQKDLHKLIAHLFKTT